MKVSVSHSTAIPSPPLSWTPTPPLSSGLSTSTAIGGVRTGGVPSAQSSARALVSAAGVAIDRASRSDLHPTSIGVVCERSDVRDLISETSSPLAGDNVVVVNGLDARLAYLRTVDTLAGGVSPILAFWGEGEETVIAAIDPLSGTIDSAHRFLSSDLFANNETFTATFALIVAERDAVPKMLVAMRSPEQSREMAAVAAEQAGLGFVFLGEPGQLAIGAALVAAAHLAALHGVPLAGAIGAPGGDRGRSAALGTTCGGIDIPRARRVVDRIADHPCAGQGEHRHH